MVLTTKKSDFTFTFFVEYIMQKYMMHIICITNNLN